MFIYGLFDEANPSLLRYVGLTESPFVRERSHQSVAWCSNAKLSPLEIWKRAMRSVDRVIGFRELSKIDDRGLASRLEVDFIKAIGGSLLNREVLTLALKDTHTPRHHLTEYLLRISQGLDGDEWAMNEAAAREKENPRVFNILAPGGLYEEITSKRDEAVTRIARHALSSRRLLSYEAKRRPHPRAAQ